MSKTEELQELFRKIYQDSDELENPNLITSNQNSHLTSHQLAQQASADPIKKISRTDLKKQSQKSDKINQSLEESGSLSSNIIQIFKFPSKLISNQTSRIQLFKLVVILNQENFELKQKVKNHVSGNLGESLDIRSHKQEIQKSNGGDGILNFREEAFVSEQNVKKQLQSQQIDFYERNVQMLKMKISQKEQKVKKMKNIKSKLLENRESMIKQLENLSEKISDIQEQKMKLIDRKKKEEIKMKNQNKIERLIKDYLDTLDKANKEEMFQSRMFKRSMQFLDPNYDMSRMWAINSQEKSEESDSNATLSPYIDFQDEVIKKNVSKLKKLKNSALSMSSKEKPPTPGKKIANSFQSFRQLELKNNKNDKMVQDPKTRSLRNSSRQKKREEPSRNFLNPNSIIKKPNQKRSFL